MQKAELKAVLKPLIKECIKEVMFEDGVLSGIISEVAQGLSVAAPLVEQKTPQKKATPTQSRKAPALSLIHISEPTRLRRSRMPSSA